MKVLQSKSRPMNKYTIQITYDATDDSDRRFRGRTVYHATGTDIGDAYTQADAAFTGRSGIKFGAITAGHHSALP